LGAKSILPAKILRERRQRILFGWLEDGRFEKTSGRASMPRAGGGFSGQNNPKVLLFRHRSTDRIKLPGKATNIAPYPYSFSTENIGFMSLAPACLMIRRSGFSSCARET
jgi:hypothetical protein